MLINNIKSEFKICKLIQYLCFLINQKTIRRICGYYCCSVAKSCPTLCDPMDCTCQAPLSFTISQSLLKFIFIESVMLSNHLIFCCPLLLLPSIFPSFRVFFSNEQGLCIRWPKYWSFSFSISPSNEYSGLSSFRIEWFDLAV